MTLLLYLLVFAIFLPSHTSGHVRLTFPPARTYALDFLHNANSDTPCGFPPYFDAPRTRFVAGSEIRLTWHQAYPHQGGFKIELIQENPFQVLYSFTDGNFVFINDSTRRYGDVILPVQHTCDECVIRLLRRASEWNSDFVFRSCSDVVILPHPDFPSERCGTSRQRRQELDMPDNIPEGVPTDFAETNQAFYNTDTGSMAYTPAPEDDDVTQGETTSADADDLGTTEPSDSGSTTSVTSQVEPASFTIPITSEGRFTSPVTTNPRDGTTNADPCRVSSALPPPDCYEGQCLNGGVCDGINCTCRRLFSGERCERKDECWDNSDCNNHGQCIDTRSTTYPRLLCYCQQGWFGRNCGKRSSVVLQQNYSSNPDYSTRVIQPDLYTLHWRLVDDEVEIAVEARTLSWVGVGWKPIDLALYCRGFPQPLVKADAENEPALGTSSNSSDSMTRNPATDPEVEAEQKLVETRCGEDGVSDLNFSMPAIKFDPKSLHPMDCSDVVVGSVKGSLHRVEDMYTRDRSTPRPDEYYLGNDDVTGAAGSQINGITTIAFRKKIKSNDQSDHPITKGEMALIWALGMDVASPGVEPCSNDSFYPHDELKYHGSTNDSRGSFKISFHDSGSIETNWQASERGVFRLPAGCRDGVVHFGCKLHVTWRYSEDSDSINFTMKYPYSPDQWAAIGFSATRHMPSSDVIIGWIDARGLAVVHDRWAKGYFSPAFEPQNDVTNISSSIDENVSTISFSRARDTGDPFDAAFSASSCWYFVFATGSLGEGGEIKKHALAPFVSEEKASSKPSSRSFQICVQSFKQSMEQEITFFHVIQLEGVTFTPGLLQPESQEFVELRAEMEEVIKNSYNQLGLAYIRGEISVEVTRFEPGSVRVHYIVTATYDPTITQTIPSVQNNMTGALGNFVQENGMHLAGSDYFVTVFGSMNRDEASLISFHSFSGLQFQRALTYIACIVAIIAVLYVIRLLHFKYGGFDKNARRRFPEHGVREQVFKDITVDEIYESIYEAMIRYQRMTSDALPLSTSSAAELKRTELMPIRRMSQGKDMNEMIPDRAVAQRDRRTSLYAPHTRPTSARSRRRKSQFLRRPSSAKTFEPKSEFEFGSKMLSPLKEKGYSARSSTHGSHRYLKSQPFNTTSPHSHSPHLHSSQTLLQGQAPLTQSASDAQTKLNSENPEPLVSDTNVEAHPVDSEPLNTSTLSTTLAHNTTNSPPDTTVLPMPTTTSMELKNLSTCSNSVRESPHSAKDPDMPPTLTKLFLDPESPWSSTQATSLSDKQDLQSLYPPLTNPNPNNAPSPSEAVNLDISSAPSLVNSIPEECGSSDGVQTDHSFDS